VCKDQSHRKVFAAPVIVLLAACFISSSLNFGIHSRAASAAESTFYDFIAQAPSASWSSGAGTLPFPGSDSDSRGFALYRDNWQLEDNTIRARVLQTHPQWVTNGWILGRYPELTPPSNAELKVTVGFFKGATASDGVTFEVRFEEFLGLQVAPKIHSILSHKATYDGKLDSTTADLSSVQGKTGNFVLYVNAGQSSGQDWAAWAEAKIEVAAPVALPDLAVGSIERDSNGRLQVTIENIGLGSLPSGWSAVAEVYFDGMKKGEIDLKAPTSTASGGIEEPGGKSSYLLAWSISEPVRVRVIVDSTDETEESNEQNNIREEEVEPWVIPPIIPPPITPPPIELPCYISGEILDFDYCLDTLRIKVCPAESIEQCTQEAGVFYVDVVRLPAEPAPTLTYLPLGPVTYQAAVSCNGSYIIEPVYSPQGTECRWIGSWEPTKYFVNMSGSKPLSTVPRDFHFVPYDSQPPTMRIMVNNTRPRPNDDVLITMLGYDDKGISSICRQTDITFLDGSRQTGPWVIYTGIVAGLEGSTGGIQFAVTDDGIMQVTAIAKVCDMGGNEYSSRLTLCFGTCDDGYHNYGETGVDCGGPCPSNCIDCLGDYELGDNPSAYLYSPDQWDTIRMWANTALSEYAGDHSLSLLELETSDELMDAIAWWVMKHMSYRADDFNVRINDNLHLGYDPFGDYAHHDFPQPAYYTLRYSGLWRSTITYTDDKGELQTWNPPADSDKYLFGDCEDYGALQVALLRSLGVSHRCVFNVEEPTHSTTIIYYKGKYRIRDYGAITYDNIWVDNLWNDKIGAFGCYQGIENGSFASVHPWEYTMNYPGCGSPRVEITGGGFGAERMWLDWDAWGTNKLAAAGDFNGDGRDDIVAMWYNLSEGGFDGKVLSSSGVNFEAPSESLGAGVNLSSSYPVYPLVGENPSGSGGDFAEVFYVPPGDEGGPRLWSVTASWKHIQYMNSEVVRLGDPDGDGESEVVEFLQGPGGVEGNGNVTVARRLWRQAFSFDGQTPFVADFDGDGADDIITFTRGESGDVWVARSRLHDFCWASYKWHDNFCLGNETPLVGDFNGDGRDDIITLKQDTGHVFVALSTVFGFQGDGWLWKDNFCYEGDTPLVGDFNGDGRDDIASLSEHDGTVRISVALANPSNMNYVSGGSECSLCQVSFFQDAYFPSKCP